MNDDDSGDVPPNDSPLFVSQDMVMQDYRESRALRTKGAEGVLHLFFSPNRVPVGLTDEEVAICVWLYRMIEAKKKALAEKCVERNDMAVPLFPSEEDLEEALIELAARAEREGNRVMGNICMPKGLRPDKPVTREGFKEGLYQILVQLSKQ